MRTKREHYNEHLEGLKECDSMIWTFFYHIDDISKERARRMGYTLGVIEGWFEDETMIVVQGP